jgi:hypothetical protein
MSHSRFAHRSGWTFSILLFVLPAIAKAQTPTQIRVATYNIFDDANGDTTPLPGTDTVLQAIGEDNVDGITGPVDILGLEETTSNSSSVAPIVADLNSDYANVHYAMSTYQATQSGSNTNGNGPNALVYNADTLTLLASVGVGTPQGAINGEFRQVVRYEFQPAGGTAAQDFYVYVCDARAGTPAIDATDRAEEATIIRNDAATLPADASIIYMGDWNTTASTDQSVVNMTTAGVNPGIDLVNPTNQSESWSNNAAYQSILTSATTGLRFRYDLQFVTPNVYNGSGAVTYVPASENALGNNGSTAISASVEAPTNTACAGFTDPTQAQTLTALTTASDHLPVVADYNINSDPNPSLWSNASSGSWNAGANWASAIIPQLQGQSATFGNSITVPATVTLDADWTVATVNFNSTNSYTLAPGNGGELTLDDGAGAAQINDMAGAHNISAPVLLNSNTTISFSGTGNSLNLSGGINGGAALTVTGNGTLVLTGSSNSVTFLTISSGASIDLTTSPLTINFGGNNFSLDTFRAYLSSGSLTSSAAVSSGNRFALGYADGDIDTDTTIAQPGQLVVQYALVGDANLDGTVNLTDLLDLLNNYGQSGTDWTQGDFNYDGTVNLTDLLDLLNNYGQSTSATQVVPEPAIGSLLLVPAAALTRRLRKPGVCGRA